MRNLAILLVVFAAIATAPWLIASEFWLNLVIMTLYGALLGQSWNILGGYGGQFSFGHAAFFGTGAYAVAVLQMKFGINPWVGLVGGAVLAMLVAVFIGYCTFRYGLRGSYFALVTLAFAEVLRILANSFDITGAGVGLLIPLKQEAFNLQFPTKTGFFFLIWAMTLAAFLVVWWIGHSRFGAQLTAVRDNEDAARALGVNPFRVKMGAIILSGLFSGLAGIFYAQYYLYLDPSIAYGTSVSIESLLVPIIGGMGTLFGPLLGAVGVHFISEVTRGTMGDAPGIALALYGAVLVLMVIFMPRGLAGLFRRFGGRPAQPESKAAPEAGHA